MTYLPGVGGGVSDGDKGDITVSGSGATWTIDATAVSLAKMADIATDSFLGRDTAGTGVPEVLSVATTKTLLGLTGTNSGDQTITLTGNVTGTGVGSFAATIANDAVTYAKLQDVSATARVVGRKTAAAGDAEECTLSEVLDFVGSAAQGDLLYREAATWTRLGAGTATYLLQTGGAGANPSWVAPPAGGTAASQAEQEAGASTTAFTSPGRQQFHPSAAKFWVKATGNSTTMVASYNMASWANTGVGDADGTIATDFSSADWCGSVSIIDATSAWDVTYTEGYGFNAQAAGTFGVLCGKMQDGGTAAATVENPDSWLVMGFGDHA
jgi:hypothetical protein